MAKAPMEQVLTAEDKLKLALVPDKERPYEVPRNWVWAKIETINQYEGISVDPGKSPEVTFELYSVPSCENDYPEIVLGSDIGSAKQAVEKDDVLLCKINPRINRVWIVSLHTDNVAIASSEWIIIRNKQMNARFLMWCLKAKYFRELMLTNVSGIGGSLMRAQPKSVKEYPIPFPPLAEQQRIVDRIESLFAKLDQAKELAQKALDSFETRKAAILHKAFTGELTKEYAFHDSTVRDNIERVRTHLFDDKVIRKPSNARQIVDADKDEVIPSHWEYFKLGQIAFVTKLAGFEYTKYIHLEEQGEIPVIRAQNVRMGYLDTTNLVYIDAETSATLRRSALYKKCLLITFIGAGIGDLCLFDVDQRFHLAPNVAKVELYNDDTEYIAPEYILNYLLSPMGQKQVFKHLKATAQPSLSMETIRDIVIPLPSLVEQREIVRHLDNLFEKEHRAKELCNVVEKIGLMKKAILNSAFRGELGTNEPGEESAVELLKECLQDN